MKHDRIEIIKYHIKESRLNLHDAEDLAKKGSYNGSLNRAYYSIYHSAKALLEFKGVETKSHSGVLAMFNDHCVRTEEFPHTFFITFQKSEILRAKADYADLYEGTDDQAKHQIDGARLFLEESIHYLEKKLKTVLD